MEIFSTPTPEVTRTFTMKIQSRVNYDFLMPPEVRTYTITSEQGHSYLNNERYLLMRAEGIYRTELMTRRETDAELDKLLFSHDWTVSVSLMKES